MVSDTFTNAFSLGVSGTNDAAILFLFLFFKGMYFSGMNGRGKFMDGYGKFYESAAFMMVRADWV